MIKANDQAFASAKLAYTLYGWLLQESAAEIGWEKTLAIQARIGGRFASMFKEMFKAGSPGPALDPAAVAGSLHECYQNFGSDYEVTRDNGSVLAATHRCPIYEGLIASGLDPAKAGEICKVASAREAVLLHEAFPELSVSLKFRDQPADPCLEEFVVKQ